LAELGLDLDVDVDLVADLQQIGEGADLHDPVAKQPADPFPHGALRHAQTPHDVRVGRAAIRLEHDDDLRIDRIECGRSSSLRAHML